MTKGAGIWVAAALAVWVTDAGAQRLRERRNDRRDRVTEAVTGWTKLGEHWVHGAADQDSVLAGGSQGRFRRVMLKVEHSALEMFDVQVTFGDGSTFSPPTRLVFGQGTWSRVIDLPGEARIIRQVRFRYGNLPGGGRAQVELWAQ
ncbi:MAG: hypothetical protein U0325_07940 [Polyangiales bacterium]